MPVCLLRPLGVYGVAFVLVIIGFVAGVSIASGALVFALSGGHDGIYWSLVTRHSIIANLARLAIICTVVASGVIFAYLGLMLAG